ncbi:MULTISPECIES: SDR family oxidoreductase [unclassified Paenibacillus]|uniref:SDR family oxidoreductase n=1 Tax=unclassified Paenibacillus TaxID=185978 RepID=UPI003633C6E0
MKKALVLGATGGSGQALVAELLNRGVETIAFGRSQSKLRELAAQYGNPKLLQAAVGDVFNPDDIIAAAKDVDVIFQSANVKYQEMASQLLPLGESVMKAADHLGKKIVIVDGIYVYGRSQMTRVTEDHPKNPHTNKGKIRVEFEKLIFNKKWQHAQALIVRLPDYYGPTSQNAYLHPTLQGIAANKTSIFIGDLSTPREYVYLPDAAKMIIEIADRDESYGENWNIPGPGAISGREILNIARKVTGYRKMVIPLGKSMISLLGLFDPLMKEVVEIMYLTKEPLILSGEKYSKRIGTIPATPFEKGIEETLKIWMQKK